MDDFDDEIDEFLNGAVSEIERRQDMQRQISFGVTVEFQAGDPGSVLNQYMRDRRVSAMEAMAGLASVHATDAIAIGQLQSAVAEYLNVRDWVRKSVEAATDADVMMQGEDSGPDADDTDTTRPASRRAARNRRRH